MVGVLVRDGVVAFNLRHPRGPPAAREGGGRGQRRPGDQDAIEVPVGSNQLVRSNPEVEPLLLAALPEERYLGFVPGIPHQALEGIVGLEIGHELFDEGVVIGPVAVIAGPYCRRVGLVRAPDVVGEDDEIPAVFATGPVVDEGRIQAPIVFRQSPDPSPIWSVFLRATRSAIVETDVGVPMRLNLVESVRDAVDESRSEMLG